MNIFLSLLSGVLLALAFPKFNLFWLAWIGLAPFFVALARAKNFKQALFYGLIFGLVFFGLDSLSVLPLFRFVKWWIVFGWLALTLWQTVFILIFCFLWRFCRGHILAGALLWTAVEWLRSLGQFGMVGGVLGYSQAGFLPLIQISSLTSVFGVSFLVALVNLALTNVGTALMPCLPVGRAVRDKRTGINPVPTFVNLALVLSLVIGCYGYGWRIMGVSRVPTSVSLKLAFIQPNIDQQIKLDPAKVDYTLNIYEQMTRQAALSSPEVIVWPETAIFSYVLRDPAIFSRVANLAREANAWLVFGTPHYVDAKAYNSVVSMSPSGEVVSRYDKGHLVPFGEYLPYRAILYPLLRGVGYYEAEYSTSAPVPLKVGRYEVATVVCFESIFPHLMRKRVTKGSDFILLVTNDAWFDGGSAPQFHLNCGFFRAIENRKYFVQVGNTGLTALIDPYGRVLQKAEPQKQEILFVEMPLP